MQHSTQKAINMNSQKRTVTTRSAGADANSPANASADPRVVGGRYWSGYWHQSYTITAIESDATSGRRVLTARWSDGRVTRHMTAWDERQGDRIVTAGSR